MNDNRNPQFVERVVQLIARIVIDPTMGPKKMKKPKILKTVADMVNYSTRALQKILEKEGTTFNELLTSVVLFVSMAKIDQELDAWVYSKELQQNGVRMKNITFAYSNADERFLTATGVTLREFMITRKDEKLESETRSDQGLTSIATTYCDNPATLTVLVNANLATNKAGKQAFDYRSVGASLEIKNDRDALLYGASLLNTLQIAIAKKVMKSVEEANDYGFRKDFVAKALDSVLGEARPDPWNVKDIGFVTSFVRWASDRKLIKFNIGFNETPEWKKKFDDFDIPYINKHNELVDWFWKSNRDVQEKSAIFMIQDLNLKELGYIDFISEPLDSDDHPWEFERKKHRRGFRDGKYYDGRGYIFFPLEDETEDEFEEWADMAFEAE
ncbi:MAG: hypothetical protein LBT59_05255 [Clostridiales bacterium]|nr:hypothetical protein [Clostridiales bacterium]